MKTKMQFRQGDVWIERVCEIPASAKKQKASNKIVLALGEATGHHHALETTDPADWWKDGGDQFIELKEAAKITHQEHAPIALPPGKYRVSIQREYSPEAIRNVRD